MNKTISILGCGWLGEPLAHQLIKNDYSVKGSTTTENKVQRLESLNIYPYLIKLESLQKNIIEFLESEILIVAVTTKDIVGIKDLICYLEKSKIKKVLFISSTSVYTESNDVITEDTYIKQSLLSDIEQLFITNPGFVTTIIRFCGLIGYNRKPGLFFPSGKIIDNPNGSVNMIHRDDCIRIIEEIISKEVWNEIFNACADSHPTRREYFSKSALDIDLEIPLFNESSAVLNKIVSNQKLKSRLKFEFKYPDIMNISE